MLCHHLKDETAMSDAIRVYLVDDHPLVREGLTNLINQQRNMKVCGEAE